MSDLQTVGVTSSAHGKSTGIVPFAFSVVCVLACVFGLHLIWSAFCAGSTKTRIEKIILAVSDSDLGDVSARAKSPSEIIARFGRAF